jgi:hypothetical protein
MPGNYKQTPRGASALRQLAAAEARRVNAEMAALKPTGPVCSSCRSEIRVVELRRADWRVYGGGIERFPPGPPQTISFCPIHGLGFSLRG